jgi:hypothetical protein
LIQPRHWLRRLCEWDIETGAKFDEYDASTLSEVALVLRKRLILPRLENFHFKMVLGDWKFRNILPSLFPASLKSLCIDAELNRFRTEDICPFLELLKPSCQNIVHLRVVSSFDDEEALLNELQPGHYELLEDLYSLPQLNSFGSYWGDFEDSHFMSLQSILPIAPLCNVTTLDLKFNESLFEALNGYNYHGPFFPRLEHLIMQADRLQGAREFLRCLSSRSLKGLRINNSYNLDQDFSEFVVDVQQYLNPKSLLHFDVRYQSYYTPSSGLTKLSPQSFAPLFAFKNLETLVVLLNQDLELLDDAHFGHICDAFPRLRILDIAGLERTTSVSIKGVMSALQRLPSLEFFGIRVPIDLPLDDAFPYRFPHITTLATRSSPLGDIVRTAEFIRTVFPSLKFLVVGAKPPAEDEHDYYSMDRHVEPENSATVSDNDDETVPEQEYQPNSFQSWIEVLRRMQILGCRYKVVAKKTVEIHPTKFSGLDPVIHPMSNPTLMKRWSY